MIVAQLIRHINNQLQDNYPNPQQVAKMIIMHQLKTSAEQLILEQNTELSSSQAGACLQYIDKLRDGEPIEYLLGYCYFYGIELKVNASVLIPRPDSECIIKTAGQLGLSKQSKVLELGTGSGCLAIALTKEYNFAVDACDISDSALEIAKFNAAFNGCKINIFNSNWFQKVDYKQYHLIVSNPPYIAKDAQSLTQLKYEPAQALIAKDRGLADLFHIIRQAKFYLRTAGFLLLEHSSEQTEILHTYMRKNGYKYPRVIYDLSGYQRASICQN